MWKRIPVVVLAVWVLFSGSAWAQVPANQVNHAAVGAGLLFFGALAIRRDWARYVTLALGIWLFVFTALVSGAGPYLYWSDAMVALALFILSMISDQRHGAVGPYQSSPR